MTPSIASEAYTRTKEDGLLKWVFQDELLTFPQFLEYFTTPTNFPVLVFDKDMFAGYAWLNGLEGKRGFGHFCFFKRAWGETLRLGNAVLDYWFAMPSGSEFIIHVIVGSTPTDNSLALRYNRKLGFEQIGVIPYMDHGKPCMISFKTREMHYGRKKS